MIEEFVWGLNADCADFLHRSYPKPTNIEVSLVVIRVLFWFPD